MLSFLIALLCAAAAGFASSYDLSIAWSVFNGIVVFVIAWLAIGLLIKKKVGKINLAVQEIMNQAQQKLNRKINVFQSRPGANVKAMQKTLAQEQNVAIEKAVAATADMKKYYKWNFLLKKQVSTMRMMLYYQAKNFKKVDELLPNCLFFDPRAIAFKLARMYKANDPKLDAFFKKKAKRVKGESCALLYGLYSWILIKRGETDKAFQLLTSARKMTDNQVIIENRERLANGKVKQFSNAGLGEMWYSLYLEEPKVRQQKAQRRFR